MFNLVVSFWLSKVLFLLMTTTLIAHFISNNKLYKTFQIHERLHAKVVNNNNKLDDLTTFFFIVEIYP